MTSSPASCGVNKRRHVGEAEGGERGTVDPRERKAKRAGRRGFRAAPAGGKGSVRGRELGAGAGSWSESVFVHLGM